MLHAKVFHVFQPVKIVSVFAGLERGGGAQNPFAGTMRDHCRARELLAEREEVTVLLAAAWKL